MKPELTEGDLVCPDGSQPHSFKERHIRLSWKDVAIACIAGLSTLSVYLWKDEKALNDSRHAAANAQIHMMREQLLPQKLDKEVYYQDMKEIKDSLNLMLVMHLQAGYKMPKRTHVEPED